MEDRLDQLFREKLSDHKVAPTENAWEQIHHQLAYKRRKKWMKHLAIAASILLFLSAGYIVFQYVKQLDTKPPVITQNENLLNAEMPDKTEIQEVNEEKTPAISELKLEIITSEGAGTVEKNKTLDGLEAHLSPQVNNSELPAKNEFAKKPIKKTDDVAKAGSNLPEPQMAELPEPQIETHMALNNENDKIETELPSLTEIDNRNDHSPVIAEDYPKITVIYKANHNSELVASRETGVLNKGIKKITKFSDEHIVTDEVKTKLRNTREDLLALNFGKIINRSNKDLEN
jgi:hypothetical protein